MKQKKHPDPETMCPLPNIANEQASTDVLGSYTGLGKDGDFPVQDADDL